MTMKIKTGNVAKENTTTFPQPADESSLFELIIKKCLEHSQFTIYIKIIQKKTM